MTYAQSRRISVRFGAIVGQMTPPIQGGLERHASEWATGGRRPFVDSITGVGASPRGRPSLGSLRFIRMIATKAGEALGTTPRALNPFVPRFSSSFLLPVWPLEGCETG